MNINELTIGQAKELAVMFQGKQMVSTHPFVIGGKYFIRTVTHHFTGQLDAVHPKELVLSKAAWIADDGRLANALLASKFNEVEPFPQDRSVIVGRGSVIDAVEIQELPTEQK